MDYSKFPKFIAFCQAQESFEGGGPSKNNPANIKCPISQPSLWHHLANGQVNGFCSFPDLKTGVLAHQENIYNICIGASKTYNAEGKRLYNVLNSGDLTIEQMISIYAPASDNNSPIHYAITVCRWSSLSVTDTMKSLLENTPSPIESPLPVPEVPVIDNRTFWQKLLDILVSFFQGSSSD